MLAYPLVEHLVEILEPWDYGDDFSPHYSAKQTATLQNCPDCWLGGCSTSRGKSDSSGGLAARVMDTSATGESKLLLEGVGVRSKLGVLDTGATGGSKLLWGRLGVTAGSKSRVVDTCATGGSKLLWGRSGVTAG